MKKLTTLLALAFYFSTNAQIITTVAGDSIGGYSGDGGLAPAGELNNPFGIATDQYRNLYIADMANSRIRMVTQSTGVISTIAGSGTFGYAGDGGSAVSAQLSSPYGIAVDVSRNVYIADYDNYVVRQVVASTGIINTIAGGGSSGLGDGGPAINAQLGGAMGVAVDASGNLYIADYNNNRIRIVNPSGTINTFAGNGTAAYGGDGGAAVSAQLNKPTGVSVDALGNVYIADFGNDVIRMVNSSGTISTVAGNGTGGYSGNGGQATAAQLSTPWNITTGSGNIYIADYGNQVIRKVNSSGVISTIAGNTTQGYTGDCGNPTSAELAYPAGVALDSYGNLYIADNVNNRIRKLLFTASLIHVTASINTTNTKLCSDTSVIFTGGGANTYTWSNGVVNGTPYTIPNYTTVTTMAFNVTGTDTNKCIGSATTTVYTINPLPTIVVSNDTICSGQYATLTALLTPTTTAATYTWTGGITNGVPFMPSSNSSYNVTGTDGNGCTNSATAMVIIIPTSNPLPVVSISSSGPITTCGGSSTLTASGATTYTWSTGSSNTSVVVSPATTTAYWVTGTLQGCKGKETFTQIVNIVNIANNVDSLCSGSPDTLKPTPVVSLASNQSIKYSWLPGPNNNTPTVPFVGANYGITPTINTTYTVTGSLMTITTTTATTDTSTCTFTQIFTQIVRALTVSSNTDSLCNGSSAIITANGADASTYTWNPGSQHGASVSVTPTVTTTYTVTGTAQTCTVTNTITQIVKPPLVVSITSSIDSICVGGTATLTASGANSYVWNTLQNGASIVVTPTTTTIYSVDGTHYGCSVIVNFTQHVDTACFAGIKQVSGRDNQIILYPNPVVNGLFTVSINENSDNVTIIILNSLGQKVFETKSTGQQTQIALPNYLPGIYYVQIISGSYGTSVKKVIVN